VYQINSSSSWDRSNGFSNVNSNFGFDQTLHVIDDKPKLAGDINKAEVRSVVRPWSSASVSQDVVKQITDINSSEHEVKIIIRNEH